MLAKFPSLFDGDVMNAETKSKWADAVYQAIVTMASQANIEADLPRPVVLTPPKPELGDIAIAMFAYSKAFHKAPAALASAVREALMADPSSPKGEILIEGGYLNVRLGLADLAMQLFTQARTEGFGHTSSLKGRRIMVEFSCPNTNKPLHLGHMRNDSIGSCVARLLKACGADVRKVNLINNRGVHICKSMLAYQKFSKGEDPASSGIKGDHLVGEYYVKFANWAKEDPTAEAQAQEMLEKWEAGDPETIALWTRMNGWTLDGLEESYKAMGISFDKYYYESNTYKLGKDKILEGLAKGVFTREEDGSVQVDLAPIKLDKKVLLRRDGTSLYITQDIGTAIARHEDWPFDTLIYVVASEQIYHFKVLFYILGLLGFDWAKSLYHLAYGMVYLPDGRMKSREGTVVDADELLRQLTEMALEEIRKKDREGELDDAARTAHYVALGAINYYLLQVNPMRDMTFNPAESLSFTGNSGPYLQYMGARLSSILKRYEGSLDGFDPSLLTLDDERSIIKALASYPDVLDKSAESYDPSLLCTYVFELSKVFSHWYHDTQILKAETTELSKARVGLCLMLLETFKSAYEIIGIPFLEEM